MPVLAMPPLWKISREFRRLGRQLGYLSGRPLDRVRNKRYRRNRDKLVRLTAGMLGPTPKVAIYVLYAPSGVPRSTLVTLEHLRGNGYAPIVISNAPLSTSDRAELAKTATAIIERPNFGYDFGAYREGLEYLSTTALAPEYVLMLNDSVWFPLFSNDDLLHRMEALNVDFAGPVHYRNKRNPAKDHIQSYMMLFRGGLLTDPRFTSFWNTYELTNNKWATIRKGEMGLSRHMLRNGLTLGAVFEFGDTVQFHNALSDHELAAVTGYETHLHPELPQLHEGSRTAVARERLSHPAATDYLLTTHPILSIRHLGLPLAKKDRHQNYQLWRTEFLNLVDSGQVNNVSPEILQEIRCWDAVKAR